ncbi:MAG: aspartyl-tRNA(Asn)/glutamyl-tRNA(Gln) amidotransferase subunit A [Phycisphaerales bacterium]|jgi:aspartyl-tRNA(Asn)/glutamyl-tRNA(Gln) amidotransferase subunit A
MSGANGSNSGEYLSAAESARRVCAGEVSAEELVRGALRRAHAAEHLNAFLCLFDEHAMEQARAIDNRIAAGDGGGPLAGVPVALKDNICLDHGTTTCASKFLEHYESPYTATAAQKLIDAGAIVIGKTNLDEFAMGSSCEHSAFGATKNPWDETKVPGGSSGGSAVAVAAGIVPIALGSDTGGSIRQPASLCGVVGLKPTYGRVSRWGLVAFASSLDQIGPFARSVEDAALVFSILAGRDERDSTSVAHEVPGDLLEAIESSPTRPRLAVPVQANGAGVDARTKHVFGEMILAFERAGASVEVVDLPNIDDGIAAYYIVATAEASSNLARFDGVRYGRRAQGVETLEDLYVRSRSEGFGPEVQRRILLGTHVLSSGYYDAYYNTALKARRLIKKGYDDLFAQGFDAVLSPACPSPAFGIGEKTGSDDPLALYYEDVFTVGASLAGLPAVTIPAGFSPEGLPVGVQLIAPAFAERSLLQLARLGERAIGVEQTVAV